MNMNYINSDLLQQRKMKRMEKFKLNSNQKVTTFNRNFVRPGVPVPDWIRRSTSYTPEQDFQIETLRAKYKLSRSAIIRILIDDQFQKENLESLFQNYMEKE